MCLKPKEDMNLKEQSHIRTPHHILDTFWMISLQNDGKTVRFSNFPERACVLRLGSAKR